MIEALTVTAFPAAFLTALITSGMLLRRGQIDQGGKAPIDKRLFYASKYLIFIPWAAIVLDSWGIRVSFFDRPAALKTAAVCLWAAGFSVMFAGRLALGSSFRIGQPTEKTQLKVSGLFRISRNPMYLGLYSTLLASFLYTVNPIVLLCILFIVAVHHRIVLAEEAHLRTAFREDYEEYCRRVRRYI